MVLVADSGIGAVVAVAEKIRKAIMETDYKVIDKVTVSIGVSDYQTDADFQQWYKNTDNALYKAKNQGRNRVIVN